MLRENFENTTLLDGKRVTDMIGELIDELLDKSGSKIVHDVHFKMQNLCLSLQYDVTATLEDLYKWALDNHLYILNGYKIRKDNDLEKLERNIDGLGKEIQSVKML